MGNIQLQQVLEAISTTAAALGDIVNDISDCSKDFTATVSQKRRSLDVIHLGNLIMQLDKADGNLSTGNRDEALLDNGTVIRLKSKVRHRLSQGVGRFPSTPEDHKGRRQQRYPT